MSLAYMVFPLCLIAAVQHLDHQRLSISTSSLSLFFPPLTDHTPLHAFSLLKINSSHKIIVLSPNAISQVLVLESVIGFTVA